ncbi:hypothetical protein CC80DRAFT_508786 [Byssothecium circinans]|uniref:Uncharacterized protein n=1 Tax=Byssothecium circinans TaxID=147558 RepID=A0A6A5THJ6_9PLEO|nr:hypothetical protein CC80DRAFT_508786 [Byssothecium circinans]
MSDTLETQPVVAGTEPTSTHEETLPSPPTPVTPTAPTIELDPSPLSSLEPKYDANEPLYTEINIPLPPLPKQKRFESTSTSRPRAHTLHYFRPFHRRGSSSESTSSKMSAAGNEAWPRIKKEIKSKEIAAAMDLKQGHRRNRTLDALAVVPTVLVLSAELFTPEEGGRKKGKGDGKWEDGMI